MLVVVRQFIEVVNPPEALHLLCGVVYGSTTTQW